MANRALLLGRNDGQALQWCCRYEPDNGDPDGLGGCDVQRMRNALNGRGYGHVRVVGPEHDSEGKMIDLLRTELGQCCQADLFVFYFSGHLRTVNRRPQLLLSGDACPEVLPVDRLIQLLQDVKVTAAAHKLVILDCCYADTACEVWTPERYDGMRFLLATRGHQRAKEVPGLQAGFFTHLLCEALTNSLYWNPLAEVPLVDSRGLIYSDALLRWLKNQARICWPEFGGQGDPPEPVADSAQDVPFQIARVEIAAAQKGTAPPSASADLYPCLHLDIDAEPQVANLIDRTRRAADALTRTWAGKTQGYPLIELTAERLDREGGASVAMLSLEQIDQALSQGGRIVLEGPAGRGKTTTLIQLAQRTRDAGTSFIVELSAWTSSGRGILEYIAGMPSFLAERLTSADLARVQQTEPFLLLLNGWNEIAETNSTQAHNALRELERDFPGAGIIVATRAHHLTPPLPGARRLRLLRLQRRERDAYLAARLGPKCAELRARIDVDPSLDELTRTPFVLAEVASLFEAGAKIPSTKMGVIDEILRLQEQRVEHRNPLQAAPIYGCQMNYLKALATEMTRRGAVALSQADARAVSTAIARALAQRGQIEPVGAPAVLAALTAHHVLERIDYPQTTFQFEHQQLQEYYAAIEARAQLLELRDDDQDATSRYTADYVNEPTWAEPLRMIAEALAEQTGDGGTDIRNTHAGATLVEMALAVDLVFAGELAQLCGAAVWNEVRTTVGERFRAVYTISDDNYRQYALAAMLATGRDDFSDIIAPLLAGLDQQVRLTTYRLWPEFHVSSLGANWRDQARKWHDDARVDFVSELLHQRVDDEVAAFAAEDNSCLVKEAAISGLAWSGSEDALMRVLESMDTKTFDDIVCRYADRMPAALKPKIVAAMRNLIDSTENHAARLATALALSEFDETGIDKTVKDAVAALSGGEIRNRGSRYIRSALEYLCKTDPGWASEWALVKIAEGVLEGYAYLLPFATAIPGGPVEEYLKRLGAEVFDSTCVECSGTAISARADARLAAGVFAKLRELRRNGNVQPGHQNETEWEVMRQLETVFRRLPDDVAVVGILSYVTSDDPLDIKVAADLLSRVARPNAEPLRLADDDLKARLRAYLKDSIDVALRQDDFGGDEKSNLASLIAQVGEPEDMPDLVTLIRADIARVRRGRAAHAAGDRGSLGNGGIMSYAGWHIGAIMLLDPTGAEQILIDFLPEPEYRTDVATAMARDFVPKPEHSPKRTSRFDLMWAAREGRTSPPGNEQRRARFAAALLKEIECLREALEDGTVATGLRQLAKALAALDGRDSAQVVLDVIAIPGRWDEYISLESIELLLMAGAVLPATTAFSLVDSILERSEKWLEDSDRSLVLRILALWPFFDDPAAGFSRLRETLVKWKVSGAQLRPLISALGASRSDAAVDLLYECASDSRTFQQCSKEVIDALAVLDTPRARELLLGLVDPDIRGILLTEHAHCTTVLIVRLTELARSRPEVTARLRKLCECDLPEASRDVISKVMTSLGTSEALAASLKLIDDARPEPVPQGVWEAIHNAFVERRWDEEVPSSFLEHSNASNELRVGLFKMMIEDEKRRRSAFVLLGQIEHWRLEHGRPGGEPRHPDFASGRSWPPEEP